MGKKKDKKNTGLGVAVWILAILVILIVFLVKQNEIKTNLKNSNFFEKVFGSTPAFITEHSVDTEKLPEEEKVVINLMKQDVSSKNIEKKEVSVPENKIQEPEKPITKEIPKVEKQKSESPRTIEPKEKAKEVAEKVTKQIIEKTESVKKTDDKTVQAPLNVIKTKICFVHYDSDGIVVRKEVSRSVEKDSPLTASLNSLLNGPSSSEVHQGCMTMIPQGTKLISVSVKSGIAYLNFSDDFEFNTHGVEGYLAQLMQIVFTATQYSSVNSVQFLINGRKIEYLGSEGVWIGSPLSRGNF